VEEVGLSAARFQEKRTGASAPVFFLRHSCVADESERRRTGKAARDHEIYPVLTRFVIVVAVESLYISIRLC